MATHFGKLQEFRPESDSIKSYLQRVTLYFEANEIDAKKQVAVLLSSIGAPIYTLLSDLLAPATPGEKSLEAISKALLDHFEPKRSIITERFHFHKRDQTATESILQYDAALRSLLLIVNSKVIRKKPYVIVLYVGSVMKPYNAVY